MNENREGIEATIDLINGTESNGKYELSGALLATHLACLSIGLPLNVVIVLLIINNSRSCRKPLQPRYIITLAATASNLLALVAVPFQLTPDDLFDQLEEALSGLPYPFFLSSVILAVAERYAAIAHRWWYQRHVTAGRVVRVLILIYVLIVVLLKGTLIFEDPLVGCDHFQALYSRPYAGLLLVLLILGLVAQTGLYLTIKRLLKFHQMVSVAFIAKGQRVTLFVHHQKEGEDETHQDDPPVTTTTSPITPTTQSTVELHHQWPDDDRKVEAARLLITGVLSLVLLTGPLTIYLLVIVTIRQGDDCCNSWMSPYFLELALIHTVVQPLIYLSTGHEFFTPHSKQNR